MNELAIRSSQEVSFSPDEINTIKNTVAKEATDTELKLFLMQCKRTGLDPFSRQIYFLKMGGKASIQSSIDGFRLIAERSGKYQGQTVPMYLDKDKKWHEVWTEPGYPVAAKVGVHKEGFKEPLYATAKWDSYAPIYNGQVGTMWKKMPEVMLAKVAEALALRKAFPNDLSGIYSSEEMNQAHTPLAVDDEYDQTPIEADAVVISSGDDTPGIGQGTESEAMQTPSHDKPAVLGGKGNVNSAETRKVREEIMKLLDEKSGEPFLNGADEYKNACKRLTNVDLIPSNYQTALERLRAI